MAKKQITTALIAVSNGGSLSHVSRKERQSKTAVRLAITYEIRKKDYKILIKWTTAQNLQAEFGC
jgi:hypothetical protein